MIGVPKQIAALNVLLESSLARRRPSEFEKGISSAMRQVKHAVIVLRTALQADPRPAPHPATVLTRPIDQLPPYRGGTHDPRRQSRAAQNIAADVILRILAELLHNSDRARVAL